MRNTSKFATESDIRQKLDSSIILFDDRPMYTRASGDTTKVSLYNLRTGKDQYVVEYDDARFNYRSPVVGYVNVGAFACVFINRIPYRMFKIGLTSNNLSYYSITGQPVKCPISNWPFQPFFADCLENIYPSADTILSKIGKTKDMAWSQAFSRNLAFGYSTAHGLRIYHKNTPIAYYNTKTSEFKAIREDNILVDRILNKYGIKQYAI